MNQFDWVILTIHLNELSEQTGWLDIDKYLNIEWIRRKKLKQLYNLCLNKPIHLN